MYEIFESLLKQYGVTTYQVAKATGISTASFTGWKQGKWNFKANKLQKIADYFGVPLSVFYGKEESPEEKKPTLSNIEELNVINDVDEIMKRIRNNETVVLRFNGEDYSGDEDEDKLLRDSLLSLCRAAKIKKKQEGFGE